MTFNQFDDDMLLEHFQALFSKDPDGMRSLLEGLLNSVMLIERKLALDAEPYERTEDRIGHANGFKVKTLAIRLGSLHLRVPQTRGVCFYPGCLEKGSRSEKALNLAIAEMYLQGVSTRKVAKITEELCGININSSQVSSMTKELDEQFSAFRKSSLGKFRYMTLDATYLKVRHSGTVISQPALIAYGVNEEGNREILGVSMSLSEAEVHWRDFLESLQKRRLSGLELITSDDHTGLRAALRATFPSVPWQRCQYHMSLNAQHHVSKVSMRKEIASAMRNIFNSPDLKIAKAMVEVTVKRFEKSAPEFTDWLEDNVEEGFSCYEFPLEHRRRIRTSNGVERVNREIKRRTRVAVLFPNAESALRLVTSVLIEIHEEWITNKKYLEFSKES